MVDRSDGLDASVSLGAMYMFYGPRNKTLALPTSNHQVYIALVENLKDRTRPPTEQLPELLREHLSDYTGFLATLRDEIVEPSQVTWRELEVLLLPSPWYRGRVILIGDAAHATTPHLASGAGIAIEDAIVLAEELAKEGQAQAAFERFMARRYERCRMVVENSEQLGEWEQRPVPDADPAGLIAHSWAKLDEPI
jgi:2-polyprenyl-6-methoxyphenol hydroxylase-like FAD-dependent oxidoreductase